MMGNSITKGKKLTESHRQKLRGENSPRWKGGITPLYHKIRRLPEYSEWRKKVYSRDNYSCIWCFSKTERLEADHIKPFAIIIALNKISTVDKALKCKELWNEKNGRTLCKKCHKMTSSYGKTITSN
jgi:5-methylcytosine-specific restriction endonuclease McrA